MKITQQKSSDKMWKDETGTQIPYSRTTKFERKAERSVYRLAADAIALNERLANYKEKVRKEAQELYDLFQAENNGNIGKGRGGCTFFNFDRTIKIEVRVHDQITFDDNYINLAKELLEEVLNDGLDGAKEFVKPLVMDAFKTSNGKLDTKRVLGLRRHESRVNNAKYSEAMGMIDKAIRKPSSKEYFRVWVLDDSGEYIDIQLNFASI